MESESFSQVIKEEFVKIEITSEIINKDESLPSIKIEQKFQYPCTFGIKPHAGTHAIEILFFSHN